jgi:hypothetical protein
MPVSVTLEESGLGDLLVSAIAWRAARLWPPKDNWEDSRVI